METALTNSFKEKYGDALVDLSVSTTKPERRRLNRRRLDKTTFYVIIILAGKASEIASGVTDFVSKGLAASLTAICTEDKPCTVTAPTISATPDDHDHRHPKHTPKKPLKLCP